MINGIDMVRSHRSVDETVDTIEGVLEAKGIKLFTIAAPTLALDLPLKLLVSEDENGTVWISYNSAAYLQARHGVPRDMLGVLAGVEALAKAAE